MRRVAAIRRLQYIKSRQVLRVWPEEDHLSPVEVPRRALLHALGPDAEPAPAAPVRYLVVAAVASADGSVPALEAFAGEDQARDAFQAVRLRKHPTVEWAQLISLDGDGRLRTLCWFGSAPAAARTLAEAWREGGGQPADARPLRWPRLRRRVRR